MQNVHAVGEANRVDGPIGPAHIAFDDFENAATTESPQCLRGERFLATLGKIERITDIARTSDGNAARSLRDEPRK